MGGIGGLMGMMPGVAKMKNQIANAGLDDKMLKRQVAIIDSMTPRERRNPDLLKASRKKRIAAGSGTTPEAINKLLKMHRGMADMMKAMGKGKRGPLAGLGQMMGFGGGAHADAGADGGARQENAGRQRCRRNAGQVLPPTDAEFAAEFPRYPGLARSRKRKSFPGSAGAARSRKEEMINVFKVSL